MSCPATTLATRRRTKSVAAILGVIGLAAAAEPCFAAENPQVLERLRALDQLIEAQQRQIDMQQRQIEAERAEINALKAQLQAAEPNLAETPTPIEGGQQKVGVTYESGRPTLTTEDGRYSLSVRGRVQFDVANYF